MKRINYLGRGQIAKFVQVYYKDKPIIYCFKEFPYTSDIFKDFDKRNLDRIFVEISGAGNISRSKDDKFYIWKERGNLLDLEHLKNYSKLHKKIKFEIR